MRVQHLAGKIGPNSKWLQHPADAATRERALLSLDRAMVTVRLRPRTELEAIPASAQQQVGGLAERLRAALADGAASFVTARRHEEGYGGPQMAYETERITHDGTRVPARIALWLIEQWPHLLEEAPDDTQTQTSTPAKAGRR